MLEKRYARLVKQCKEQTKQVVAVTRHRGGKKTTHRVVLTFNVKRKLNNILPKLRAKARTSGYFTAVDLSNIANVRTPAANRYINILIAFQIVKSDGKSWNSTYTFINNSNLM